MTIRRVVRASALATTVFLITAAAGFQTRSLAATHNSDTLDLSIGQLIGGAFGPNPCVSGQRETIGIWVFDSERVPVGAAAAQRLHEELLARLLRSKPQCIDVLDSAGIGVIIDYLSKSGALDKNGGNVIAALNEANQKVDLIVFPSLYNQGGKTVLALRAVERKTGRTLALSSPAVVPEKYLKEDVSDQAIGINAAVSAAAKYFADIPELKVIRPLGVFFEDTGAQPTAGRYLMDQLVVNLTRDVANVLTGKVLQVRGLTIEPSPNADGTVPAADLEGKDADASVYDLSGRYWIQGNVVSVRFSMKRGDSATFDWQGKIQISEFKGLELHPTNPAVSVRPAPVGAFAFQLTSPKGNSPIYRPGDELTLLLRVGQEASVYCFYVDSKGGVLTVLPNRFSGSDTNANRFAAKVLRYLPDPSRDKFSFKFTADTTGEEMVDCFASTRDVRVELPRELFSDQIAPVSFLTVAQLRKLFANLKNTKVSEASVTVTVTQ